ncbi:target of Nesh-SH3 isoform X3 [Nothobranchius furzeri]|uniref:Transcript variant X1 n=7 Tax=Nothobranchius TaxID=28779 RepID=A0A9D3BMI5_NOTFU|nr:target of Nesh-SH3 isoform X1 [Nothobranchius furzeri]KAF7215512.1 transcript variant X1 [Nothobranchius furzeri]
MRMQQHSVLLLFLMAFITGIALSLPQTSYRSRVRRHNMKVRISATRDTIVMKFLQPDGDTKLEGYIMGYGSSMFSKQFIQLPENGQPYETEFEAEPKYLIAVQPVPSNEVKKHCKGKVELEKPLHLVIGSVSPTSVLLSWGTLLKTPYEGNIMNDCLEDGHYTVRYREKNRKWKYQTCPTSDTVIDNLKPNSVYEFGVQPNSKDGTGKWSKPVVHNVSVSGIQEKVIRKIVKRPVNTPPKPFAPGPRPFPFPPQHAPQNRTQGREPFSQNTIPQTTPASTTTARQEFPSTVGPKLPLIKKQPIDIPQAPKLHPQVLATVTTVSEPVHHSKPEKHGELPKQKLQSQPNTQTHPNFKHQQQYQPIEPNPNLLHPTNPYTESTSELLTTSHPEIRTNLQLQGKKQSLLQTFPLSQPKQELYSQSVHQTTPQPLSESKLQSRPESKHQTLPPTILHHKTQNKHQAQFQPASQPALMVNSETTQSTPSTQETPPKIEIYPLIQPETHLIRPQIQPQVKTPKTKPTQLADLPKIANSQSKPSTKSKRKKPHQTKKQPNPMKRPKDLNLQGLTNNPPNPNNPEPTLNIAFQPKHLPKENPGYGVHPKSELGVQSKPQTRTDHFKGTPKKAIHKAPSLPEGGKPLPRPPLATEKAGSNNDGSGIIKSSVDEVPHSPVSSSVSTGGRNVTVPHTRIPSHSMYKGGRPFSQSKTSSIPDANGAHHRGNSLSKPGVWSGEKPVLHPHAPENKRPNLVGESSDHDKPMDLKQGEKESILKSLPPVTAIPTQERRPQTTTMVPAVNSTRFDMNENASIFRSLPSSEVDIMGKKRFVASHVIYKTDKKPDEPCSITSSMAYFPNEEGSDQNVTSPPRTAPSNVTVVTVEGCPSFVILDWDKSDNETREYEVVSTTTGPHGKAVSILTTNQTHTTVENLTPESSYEFKVTPKNELGTGPSSEPVTFSTESADPRVSEHASGKDAIWTQFPFKSDAYSECNGKQYVKRTWYRKFVGIQLCNSLRYKIYLSDSLTGKFYNIGDQTGFGEDHCQFVDSFLDGKTGARMLADQLQSRQGFFRALRQEPVHFGEIGGKSHATYVGWYECGTPIPGKW